MKKIFLGVILSGTILFALPFIGGGSGGGGSNSGNTLIVDNTPTSSWFWGSPKSCENTSNPYATIQDAVDDAQDGDTISICDGTYEEAVSISGKNNLNIKKSAYASDDVIVKNDDYVFNINSINGLTIDSISIKQTSNKAAISINSYSKNLLFKNLYIKSENADGIETNGENEKLELQDSSIEAGDDGLDFNANINGDIIISNTEINASDKGITTDGDINGDINISDTNISAPNAHGLEANKNINGALNIKNLIIEAHSYGINTKGLINKGLTISDTNITSKSESLEIEKDVSDGVNITNTSLNSEDDAIDFSGKINNGLTISDSNITASVNAFEIDGEINGGTNIVNCKIIAGEKGFEFTKINGGITVENSSIDAQTFAIQVNKELNQGCSIEDTNLTTDMNDAISLKKINDGLNVTNVIINSESYGIKLNDEVNGGVDISNVNITNNTNDAINAHQKVNNGFTIENSVLHSKENGLYFHETLNGDVNISDVNITAESNGIQFHNKINNGVTISLCDINSTSAKGVYFEKDVYNHCDIDNVTIHAKDRGIYFNNKQIAPIITNSNIISSNSDGIYTKNNNSSKFTLKDSCVKTEKNNKFALWINNSSTNAEVTGNCFYATAVNKLAKAAKEGNDVNSNYWDELTDATYEYNHIKDIHPLKRCQNSCGGATIPVTVIDYYMDECNWDNDSNTYEVKNSGTLGNDYNASAVNNANTIDDGKIYRGGDINSSAADDKAILAKIDYSLPNKYTLTTWIKFPLNTDGHKQFRIGSGWNRKWVQYFNIADRVGSDNDLIYFTKDVTHNSWSLSVKDDSDIDTINFNPQDLSGWHMLTFVVTDNGTDFYLDQNKNNTFSTHPNTGQLGLLYNSDYNSNNDNKANGQSIGTVVDEFKIFNRVLDSTQIEDIYNYDGSDRPAPQCGENPPEDQNSTFNAVDFISGNCNAVSNWDDNITTKIVNKDINLTILAKDGNQSTEAIVSKVSFYIYNDYKSDNTCNGTYKIKELCNGNCGTTDQNGCLTLNNDNTNNKNYDENATKCVIVHIEGRDKNNTSEENNESNSTDNFAIRPKKFKITQPTQTIYAGEDFNITFQALNNNDTNTTDYNERKGVSFDINVSEIKNGCEKGNYSGDVVFNDGGNTTVSNYDEISDHNLSIKIQEINSSEFAKVDEDDTPNEADRLITPDEINITVKPYDINVTNVDFKVSTEHNWLYMAENNTSDMNITLKTTVKAFNKQGNVLKDFNSTCYAKDVDVKFYYDINSSVDDVNLTLDGNITDDNVSILDINKTLQISKVLFRAGEANSSYAFGIDRKYNEYKNPKTVTLNEANITTTNISKYQRGKTLDSNNSATFYYARTYTQDLSTSKKDDNTTVEILVYADKDHKSFVSGFREELLDWYLNGWHTESDGDIRDSNISSSTFKSTSDSVESSDFNSTPSFDNNGTFNIQIHNSKGVTGTYYIHLGEDRWLWYVPQNFGGDYNDSNNSNCTTHPCIKYTYEQDDNQSGVQSGNTTGVQFDVNVSKNNRGVRLLR